MRFGAHGLKPILDAYFPRLMALAKGNFVPVVDGVAVEVPQDAMVEVRDLGDRVLFQLPGGLNVHVAKNVGPFGIIPVNAMERMTAAYVDQTGIDVQLEGWRNPIRLEALP